MPLSEKQIVFRDYLLKRLGFTPGQFLTEYKACLEESAYMHKSLGAIPVRQDELPPPYHFRDGEFDYPTDFGIIDFLCLEYQLKKRKNFRTIFTATQYIFASDLANYSYCPVGYSIAKTFEIKKSIRASIGEQQHNEHRLLEKYRAVQGLTSIEERKNRFHHLITNNNRDFFTEVLSSRIAYAGHENPTVTVPYINTVKKFSGKPDYIFVNKSNQHFIVEEKFRKDSGNNSAGFFDNHKVQLASYIYYISQIRATHGYLLYWFYDYLNGQFRITKCKVYKIGRTAAAENFLEQKHRELAGFISSGVFKLPATRNSSKCAKCVYCAYCGHKTGRESRVTVPYQVAYNKLYDAPFPEILKKSNTPSENHYDTGDDIYTTIAIA